MMRTTALVLFLLVAIPTGARAATCDGAGPTITSVTLHDLTRTRYLDLYHLTATVTNLGNQAQPGNVLQFVDVVQYGARLDDRGVPPLAPGQSYTVSYIWPRSTDAGKMTSPLDFHIRLAEPELSCAPAKGRGITV
jgi:CARDB protein